MISPLCTKLTFGAMMSSLWALLFTGFCAAHEVFPAVVNLHTTDTTLTLQFDVNLEAMLAGIDLEKVTDTDQAESAGDYASLRALDDTALGAALARGMAALSGNIKVTIDGQGVPLRFVSRETLDPGDPDLPRQTVLTFSADLPAYARQMQIGWARSYGTLVVRQNSDAAVPYTTTLKGGDTSAPFHLDGSSTLGAWTAFGSYVPIGFDHILPKGLDHILFVLGLFFLSTRIRPLLWQVSAFTLAHTVTLALGALGWVTLPASIVEPLIAASICYVAVENLVSDRLSRWRPVVIFGFGLLHGLGFASVLGDVGLPTGQFFPALIGFNVGVELGQLAVIVLAFLAVGLWFRNRPWYRRRIAMPASLAIALVGAYWVIERVFF